jgi:hypothetical protein
MLCEMSSAFTEWERRARLNSLIGKEADRFEALPASCGCRVSAEGSYVNVSTFRTTLRQVGIRTTHAPVLVRPQTISVQLANR